MKKFSLKFILFAILCLFSSFVYADGVFSKYNNDVFLFSIDVPITQYKIGTEKIIELNFMKDSKSIPTKDFFSAFEAESGDGLTIKDKSENITILAYGTNFLNSEEVNGLEDTENIKESFKYDNLNYNEFIKKYYNGKSPKNINPLKYDYNKALFINGNNVAYNTIGKDFYVVSYIENNKIHYKKVIYNRDENSYAVFEATYLPKDKKIMDKIVAKIANSIKFLKIEY